ncbi:MAG: hypothetical protein IPH89_15520 [Bacteroidetes bacterium]|nr:hypothetical protein [Bacteroidota bacterium]
MLLIAFPILGYEVVSFFCQYSPEIENKLPWAVLYFPSPLFWGSGVSKDTFTYFGTVLFVYSAHEFFIKKKEKVFFFLFISAWLIVSIKPYIFLILFPGGLLWIFYNKMSNIKSPFLSFFFL